MHVELVDALRCPGAHGPATLVAAVDQMIDRSIIAGTLGCPVCDARYPIVDGVAYFDGAPPTASGGVSAPAPAPAAPAAGPGDDAVRLAALLDLRDGGGIVLLEGEWATAAAAVHEIADSMLVPLNPPRPIPGRGAVSPVFASAAPLAAGTLRGAALSADADPAVVASVTAALRPRARLIGPPSLDVPPGMRELARDARGWVAEQHQAAASPPVALRRERPRQGSA